MALAITIENTDHFMTAHVSGVADLAQMLELAGNLVDEAKRRGARRLLVDLREVRQNLKLTEHIILSEKAVSTFGRLERVATIVPEGANRGTTEHAARQRGVQFRVFNSPEAAAGWISADQ